MWDTIKKFLADRMTEASTGRAITILLGLVGWKVAPEHIGTISEFVVMALVLFGVLPDRKKTEAELAAEEKALKAKKLEEAKKLIKESEAL
jgi:hypothetical protein